VAEQQLITIIYMTSCRMRQISNDENISYSENPLIKRNERERACIFVRGFRNEFFLMLLWNFSRVSVLGVVGLGWLVV
jgi:hypothetical protein